jgi:hypothetical protein
MFTGFFIFTTHQSCIKMHKSQVINSGTQTSSKPRHPNLPETLAGQAVQRMDILLRQRFKIIFIPKNF